MTTQAPTIKSNFARQPKFVRWLFIALAALVAVILALLMFAPVPQPKVDAVDQARAVTPAPSPQARAAAFERFDTDVRKLLQFSDAVVGTFRVNSAGKAGEVEMYELLKSSRDMHSNAALDSAELPAELVGETDLANISEALHTLYAVRAAAFDHGMLYLQNRKPADAVEMRDRLERMDIRSKEIIAALSTAKPTFSPR